MNLALAVLLVAAMAALVWYALHRNSAPKPVETPTTVVTPVEPRPMPPRLDRVDPVNEDRAITLVGLVKPAAPVADPQLGITANALALMREVEMRQWRERCANGRCDYELVWSRTPIDSSRFRDAKRYANTARFPFVDATFSADDIRLGAYRVEPRLATADVVAVPLAVTEKDLPPNLAASFRVDDGVLLASANAQKPAVGDLRVRYRIVPVGERRIAGVQRKGRIEAR